MATPTVRAEVAKGGTLNSRAAPDSRCGSDESLGEVKEESSFDECLECDHLRSKLFCMRRVLVPIRRELQNIEAERDVTALSFMARLAVSGAGEIMSDPWSDFNMVGEP